jgi:cytochrome d ubiquinol oxidase subunit II
MSQELIGISVLWIFLYGYLIVASIDFGAGFFSIYSDWFGKKHVVHKVIQRYLSPVWEVTNVFLVFFFVGIVGFFPKTAYYYGTTLFVPISISIILLAIRGSYYAFGTYGHKENKIFTFLYGVTGLLIPASLTTVLTISEGGFIKEENGTLQLLYSELFKSPYSWSVVLLAIVSVLFISASFLTYYAHVAKDEKATQLLRKYALAWSFPTILAAIVVFFTLKQHNAVHYNEMLNLSWAFLLSLVSFGIAIYLLYRQKYYGIAFIAVMAQFAFAFFAYGFSHYPYLLYPMLTIHDGFTNEVMANTLILSFVAGLLVLVPSLYLLMRLFLFNRDYVQGKK